MSAPAGLNCPECGELAVLVISEHQAFCGNEASCRIVMWDPAKTIEQMYAEGVHEIDLRKDAR